jgi:hypothetical protein
VTRQRICFLLWSLFAKYHLRYDSALTDMNSWRFDDGTEAPFRSWRIIISSSEMREGQFNIGITLMS